MGKLFKFCPLYLETLSLMWYVYHQLLWELKTRRIPNQPKWILSLSVQNYLSAVWKEWKEDPQLVEEKRNVFITVISRHEVKCKNITSFARLYCHRDTNCEDFIFSHSIKHFLSTFTILSICEIYELNCPTVIVRQSFVKTFFFKSMNFEARQFEWQLFLKWI